MIKTIGKSDIIVRGATSGDLKLLESEEYGLLKELIDSVDGKK